ncbi:MAG: PLP-dependent aminotransferase family protein, partial [Gemmatimonadales bacterium]
HLELVPSAAGLHVAALAVRASAERIGAVARRASGEGVEVQELSRFAVSTPGRAGLMLGFGGIATGDIEDGLHRLRACFER